MNQKIEGQLQRIDTQLNKLLTDLQQYPADHLQRKPTPTDWSVVQVLQHMILVENVSIQYVRKKLSYNPTLKNANLLTSLRVRAAYLYNLVPIKFKAPKYVDETNFSSNVLLTDIVTQWQNQRLQLRAYLASLSEDLFQKEVYKNPIVGRLSLYGMLQFFEGHFERHEKQIRRLLKV